MLRLLQKIHHIYMMAACGTSTHMQSSLISNMEAKKSL